MNIRGLTRGLATLPQRWIQEPLVVRDRDGRPQEDPLSLHCFCVCSGSALLGDILGVSRSMEGDLSVLSIYPRTFLCVFIVYRLLVGKMQDWNTVHLPGAFTRRDVRIFGLFIFHFFSFSDPQAYDCCCP